MYNWKQLPKFAKTQKNSLSAHTHSFASGARFPTKPKTLTTKHSESRKIRGEFLWLIGIGPPFQALSISKVKAAMGTQSFAKGHACTSGKVTDACLLVFFGSSLKVSSPHQQQPQQQERVAAETLEPARERTKRTERKKGRKKERQQQA